MEISQESASKQKLGYVVVRQGEKGYIGGYLCADERGVPIEFWHTTGSPVRADRLQMLLYGKTLKSELLGRHITGSLLGDEQGKPRIKPHVLLTEEDAILYGVDLPGITVILIEPVGSNQIINDECTCRRIVSGAGDVVIRWKQENTAEVEQLIPSLKSVDVLEPFKRIYALLDELGGKGSERNKE
jgi:hypothetical protein